MFLWNGRNIYWCNNVLLRSTFRLGLPIEVRDKALAIQDNLPKSDVNKEFYTQNIEKEVYVPGNMSF